MSQADHLTPDERAELEKYRKRMLQLIESYNPVAMIERMQLRSFRQNLLYEKDVEERESKPPKPTKERRSTVKNEGRDKLIGVLTKHHEYAEGGCLNQEPISVRELARQAVVSSSTASKFFNDKFNKGEKGGYVKYRATCRDSGRLADSLKALNNEFTPSDLQLYGRLPNKEDNRKEED